MDQGVGGACRCMSARCELPSRGIGSEAPRVQKERQPTMREIRYRAPAISCAHCVNAISGEVGKVHGVQTVTVDVETKLVTVRGEELDDAALRAAIDEAGYDVQPA